MKHNFFVTYELKLTQASPRPIDRKGVGGRNGSISFLYKHLHKDGQQARRSDGFCLWVISNLGRTECILAPSWGTGISWHRHILKHPQEAGLGKPRGSHWRTMRSRERRELWEPRRLSAPEMQRSLGEEPSANKSHWPQNLFLKKKRCPWK